MPSVRKLSKNAERRVKRKQIREAKKASTYIRPGTPRSPDAKYGDDFYNSRQWRELRYLALRCADGACQCCGARASSGVQIHVDHIKPRSRYPELQLCLDNLQVLCADCNIGKGAWDDTDWRSHWKSL